MVSIILGAGFSAASLLLAGILARQITRPIESLRQSFADISAEPAKPIAAGPPEIMELQDSLYRAATARQNATQALTAALSKREREMALRRCAGSTGQIAAHGRVRPTCGRDGARFQQRAGSHLRATWVWLPRSTDKKIHQFIQAVMDATEMGCQPHPAPTVFFTPERGRGGEHQLGSAVGYLAVISDASAHGTARAAKSSATLSVQVLDGQKALLLASFQAGQLFASPPDDHRVFGDL
jgi:hypothetical protein